jgi:uncharacterized repeat protein (TIGR03806 family)
MRLILSALAFLGAAVSGTAAQKMPVSQDAILAEKAPDSLSAFGFFDGTVAKPAPELIAYALRTPLFSDYAEKQRFIYLPTGKAVAAEAGEGRLQFPVGTAIIKSFGYPDIKGVFKPIETRVLLHKADGWVALPYVWRADGRDADLRVGGTRVAAHFQRPGGAKQDIQYAVPNKNQCKQCHAESGALMPIGPRLANMVFTKDSDKTRLLARAAMPAAMLSSWPKWDDPKSGSVASRATAYLRINCGHCHNPAGSASNSGLYFDGKDHGAANAGINKRPVAAGRGSGDLDFVISPGDPAKSILIHRMKSLDPGVAMPELGRATVHAEGVRLIEEWIKEMKAE